MAAFFIDRPVFAIVLSLVILIAGTLALLGLPIAQYPQITLPTISVTAAYPGAGAAVVEQAIAQPVEQQVNGVEGMRYMSSNASSDGYYSLSVTFDLARDADIAAVQVQNRVAVATSQLPSEVVAAGVTTRKKSPDTLMYFALHSPGGTYDELFLKNYGSIYVTDALKRVAGVGEVGEYGSDYGMRIWLDPEKMARLKVTTGDVLAAVREQNVQAAAGQLGQFPAPADQAFQYSAEVRGRLVDPEEFGRIILRTEAGGRVLRLSDVAEVAMGAKEYRYFGTLDGKPAAIYTINLTPDASAVETSRLIRAELDRLAADFPPDMAVEVVQDNTVFVEESLAEVVKTFGEALLLVLLVVFVFLQSWRATLIPMLAVPVSLVGTFAAFVVLGFTVNTLTLFGLVLAIGIVVDDAIVVVEAVEHHLRGGKMSPVEATRKAMSEVSGPVVAIALVLSAVFVPVAFMGGISGVMYQQFGLTVAVSVLLSALVALTLTPALCAMLMRAPQEGHGRTGFFGAFNRAFDALTERYGRGVALAVRRSGVALGLLLALGVGTWGLLQKVPSAFVPDEDQGFFLVGVSLPEASTLARTRDVVAQVEAAARGVPGVQTTLAITGVNVLLGTAQPNQALMVIKLAPWGERGDPALSLEAAMGGVMAATRGIAEARVMAFNPPSIPGLSTTGGFSLMLQDRGGNGPAALEAVAQDFLAAANARPEIGMAYTSFSASTPSVRFEVDRDRAKQLGVPVNEVFAALQTFLGGLPINDFTRFGRTYKVTMQAAPAFRGGTEALSAFYLRSASGAMVPLSTFVSAVPTGAPGVIKRYNVYPAAEIGGQPAAGYSSGQALAALEEVARETLPAGYGYAWSGLSLQERESGGQAPVVLALALVFVFLVLAAQYESWSVPFAVLLSIPVGVFGAMLGLLLAGLTNNVYTQIGLVLLIGLAAKNAILIVEFARVRRAEGLAIAEAALEAAKLRLRPILMTSFAFILGVVPLVLASGAGAGSRVSLGTSVFAGMLAATVIGVFIVPVLYAVIQRLAERAGAKATPAAPPAPSQA
jgi:hydrophobe/amphiphile efflux-1 (HAE1) family protein